MCAAAALPILPGMDVNDINPGFRESIRVLLVSDNEQELWGLAKLIDGEWPRLKLIGTARSLSAASARCDIEAVDVLVIDMALALKEGPERFVDVHRTAGCCAVVLGDGRDRASERVLLEAGACAVVRKDELAEGLLEEIERAALVAARNAELPEASAGCPGRGRHQPTPRP